MGNIIASQWWHQMAKEIPNQDELMAQGKLDPIREWLIENVQKHGRKYLPNELIQRVTGGSMDTAPYLAYLESKYKALYHL
jgi:carboxypeptidase Taq